jgi:hypothetical protein
MANNEKGVTITVKPNTYKRLLNLKNELSFKEFEVNGEKRKRVYFNDVITYLLDKV